MHSFVSISSLSSNEDVELPLKFKNKNNNAQDSEDDSEKKRKSSHKKDHKSKKSADSDKKLSKKSTSENHHKKSRDKDRKRSDGTKPVQTKNEDESHEIQEPIECERNEAPNGSSLIETPKGELSSLPQEINSIKLTKENETINVGGGGGKNQNFEIPGN